MSTSPAPSRGTTAAELIDAVVQARNDEHEAAVRQVELIASWAMLHPCADSEWPAHWGDPRLDEQVVPLAGEGAPLVAEWAPAELAAALGISLETAKQRIGDALELTCRMRRLWDLTVAGRVPVWLACAISRETHDLSVDAVAYADRLICAVPEKIRLVRAEKLVNEARLHYDPDRAVAEEEHQLARRGVWVRHTGNPATTDISMTLDTLDAYDFAAAITIMAAELAALGDTSSLEVRKAKAVGILAHPEIALNLLHGLATADEIASTRVPQHSGNLQLYVHLTPADLADDLDPDATGAASIETLGAATTHLLEDWLTRCTAAGSRVIVRPVLDLADPDATPTTAPVDQHDPPAAIRELCVLRDAHCVFPGCRRDSRSCDLDHITPYVPLDEGGPPGQTHPGNLAPLCRTHHRIKTHTVWDYKRRDDGTYVWTSPTGHQYDVHPVSRRPPDPPDRPDLLERRAS